MLSGESSTACSTARTTLFSITDFGNLGMNHHVIGKMTINDCSPKSAASTSNALNSAMAGYVAGVSGTVIGYPLDSAKVWLQTNTVGKNKHMLIHQQRQQQAVSGSLRPSGSHGTSNSTSIASLRILRHSSVTTSSTSAFMSSLLAPSNSTGAAASLSYIGPTDGTAGIRRFQAAVQTVRALYSGVAGPLLTVGVVQGINFATYDATRRLLYRWDTQQSYPGGTASSSSNYTGNDYLHCDSLLNVGVAGVTAGAATALVTAPLILLKTHQQITGHSFRRAVRETLLTPDGSRLRLGGCVAGFVPHALSETLGRGVYYAAYEASKRSLGRWKEANNPHRSGDGGAATTTLQERMICAAASGILCWVAIFPLDALRSRLYSDSAAALMGDGRTTCTTMMGMIRIMRQEGSFYRGFWLTVFRAGPVAAAVLPVYDMTLEFLSARDVST